MPLPPSRKDVTGPPPLDTSDLAYVVRHLSSTSRQIDPGLLGGRAITPRPNSHGPSQIVGGDTGDDAEDSVVGEDGDRLVLTDLGTQTWLLSYVPISETLVVRWHPDAGAGVEWKRGEHYSIDDDGQVVTITAAALAAAGAEVDDVFSAQYLRTDDYDTSLELDVLLRGASLSINSPADLPGGGIDLSTLGVQIGDFIVAGNASMYFDGTPGSGTISDSRLTQVGHGVWVGRATHLGPVQYTSDGDPLTRHTGAVAVFAVPVDYLNDTEIGPSGPGTGVSVAAPVVAAAGAVLVVTEDNASSVSGNVSAVPTGYALAVNPNTGGTVCKVGIWYWVPDGSSSSPAGNITYEAHDTLYATAVGLQGDA